MIIPFETLQRLLLKVIRFFRSSDRQQRRHQLVIRKSPVQTRRRGAREVPRFLRTPVATPASSEAAEPRQRREAVQRPRKAAHRVEHQVAVDQGLV